MKKNVVMIMLDEHNKDYLGAYGNKYVKTPNLDRLAASGAIFENAVCVTPYCSPTRASIVTGQYPHTNSVVFNTNYLEGLDGTEVITEQILFDNGYKVGHFGKWHAGNKKNFSCYANSNYTEFYAKKVVEKAKAEGYIPAPARDGEVYVHAGGPFGVYMTEHNYKVYNTAKENDNKAYHLLTIGRSATLPEHDVWLSLADESANFINENKDNNFMLTFSASPPHEPYIVPEPYYSMYDPNEIELSPSYDDHNHTYHNFNPYSHGTDLQEEGLREYMRCYFGMITMMDNGIGKILKTLDDNDLTKDTLILFVSDHGELCTSHGGMFGKVIPSFYNEILNVPMFISMPSVIAPNTTVKGYANSVDIAPTILDLLGFEIPSCMQGKSFKDILTGATNSDEIGTAFAERPEGRMVQNGEYKYCYYFNGSEIREELFDIANDKNEVNNLANNPAFQNEKSKLIALLEKYLRETNDMSMDELFKEKGPKGNLGRRLEKPLHD